MKENLCTIPINDVFAPKCGCPMCRMEAMLEQNSVIYITGAAMMEPDIRKIADTFDAFRNGTLEDEAGYCAVKTLQDIKAQDFILTPGRYVGIAEQEDDGEPFAEKMQHLTSELSGLFEESHRLEDEIKKQLGSIGFEIA